MNAVIRKQRKEGTTRLKLYQDIITILRGFPLHKKEAEQNGHATDKLTTKRHHPQIIISESFH